MKIYKLLQNIIDKKGAAYFILIDPDKLSIKKTKSFITHCEKSGVDGFLIGGSLMIQGDLNTSIKEVKKHTKLPVIIFPRKRKPTFASCRCSTLLISN